MAAAKVDALEIVRIHVKVVVKGVPEPVKIHAKDAAIGLLIESANSPMLVNKGNI